MVQRFDSDDIAHIEKLIETHKDDPCQPAYINIDWLARAVKTMRRGIIPAINQTNSRPLTEAPK